MVAIGLNREKGGLRVAFLVRNGVKVLMAEDIASLEEKQFLAESVFAFHHLGFSHKPFFANTTYYPNRQISRHFFLGASSRVRETLERETERGMEEQIKSEFKRSGFGLEDEQEILSKCKRFFPFFSLDSCTIVYLLMF